jgi:ABC-type oligopeptide transport system ATPase subunit
MSLGELVELVRKRNIFAAPKHPYTNALLSVEVGACARCGSARIILKGDVASPINPPRAVACIAAAFTPSTAAAARSRSVTAGGPRSRYCGVENPLANAARLP